AHFDALVSVREQMASIRPSPVPAELLNELRNAGRAAAGELNGRRMFAYDLSGAGSFRFWLMPTFVAAAATIVLGFALITSILSGYENIGSFDVAMDRGNYSSTRVFVPGNSAV